MGSVSSKRRLLLSMVLVLLLAGGGILGVLQVHWVTASSDAEERRQRDSLERSATRAAIDAEQDIRAIMSLTRIDPGDFAARDWTSLRRGLRIWYSTALFPGFLEDLYLVIRLPDGGVSRYDASHEALVPAVLPPEVRAVAAETLGREGPPWIWPSSTLPGGKRIFAQPLISPGSARGGPKGALLAVLDLDTFYRDIVPHYVALDVGDLPYRLVEESTGRVLAASGGIDFTHRRPDALARVSTMPIGNAVMQGLGPSGPGGGRPPGAAGGGDFDVDPLLQFWMQRARATAPDRASVREPEPPRSVEARLEVYSAHGSLATTIRQQEVMNLGISLGILVLMLASAFTLSRLYLRVAALRASEQGFVASMSHELRTPISVIQATSENLSRGVVSDPARVARYADVIYGQIKRLAGMVEGILIYAGLQSGRPWAPSIAEVDLTEIISEITQPLHYLAASVGSTLVVRTEGMPPVIRSDRVSLSVIVENLVMNAIRHADPEEILLSLEESDGFLRIVVEDRGPGIPSREQHRVFDAFVRGERSIREQKPGSGLGLHLVRRVTQLLEGSVTLTCPYTRADGTVVRGCRFVVLLPQKEAERGA